MNEPCKSYMQHGLKGKGLWVLGTGIGKILSKKFIIKSQIHFKKLKQIWFLLHMLLLVEVP